MRTDSVTVREGESLLAALTREGAFVEAACGGHGRCRRCRVRIDEGPGSSAGPEDLEQLHDDEARAGWRLACRVEAPGSYRVTAARPVTVPEPVLPGGPGTGRAAAVAVDLGTTTIGAALVDAGTGRVLGRAARGNLQVAYGADVLTRVAWARAPDHRARLADLARRGVTDLLARLLGDAERTAADVARVVLAGNASMTLLFLGLDPERLARPPYESGLRVQGALPVDPATLGLPGRPDARFLPALGGHVGSDTTAAILAAGLAAGPLPALLVDLGTNGEVALATDDGILVASSAAGPAFEGGGIEHGSPAGPGAVERVEEERGGLRLATVDGSPPRSWCGSGVIEITAALRERGTLDASGRIADAPDLPVPFTQADVRETQLAKGAIAAATRILAREAGIGLAALKRVVLTGAFGARLRPGPARRIGLVPDGPPVEALEGGALAGAVLALAPAGMDRAVALAGRVRHVSLGDRPDFQDVFVESLSLDELRS